MSSATPLADAIFAQPDLLAAFDSGRLIGWTPNPDETAAFVATLAHPTFASAAPEAMVLTHSDRFLWLPMMRQFPAWQRIAQAIGDCVSHGWELGAFMLACCEGQVPALFATEPIYGGSRVEARGGRLGGYSDGSYGAAAAKWIRDWGVLLRQDYSGQTGDPDHDLRGYSGRRAKDWGNFGCGGKRDERGNGKLDQIARQHPLRDVALVKTVDEAAAAIMAMKPVVVCSDVGFGNMVRDSNGVVRRRGTWNHCMMYGGVRWVSGEPQFRQFQSWGKSCSGPDPGIEHQAVSDCSWWTMAEDAERQLRQGDSFALAGAEGWDVVPETDNMLI